MATYTHRRIFFLSQDFENQPLKMKGLTRSKYNEIVVNFIDGSLVFWKTSGREIDPKNILNDVTQFKRGDWVEIIGIIEKDPQNIFPNIKIKINKLMVPTQPIERMMWAFGFTKKMRIETKYELIKTYFPNCLTSPYKDGFTADDLFDMDMSTNDNINIFQVEENGIPKVLCTIHATSNRKIWHPHKFWLSEDINKRPEFLYMLENVLIIHLSQYINIPFYYGEAFSSNDLKSGRMNFTTRAVIVPITDIHQGYVHCKDCGQYKKITECISPDQCRDCSLGR